MVNKDWYQWKSGDLQLRLQVLTRTSTEKFGEVLQDRIKLRIKTVAVDGKANETIIRFLAKEFRTPRSSITIIRGQRSTKKLVNIHCPGRLPGLPGLNLEAGVEQ